MDASELSRQGMAPHYNGCGDAPQPRSRMPARPASRTSRARRRARPARLRGRRRCSLLAVGATQRRLAHRRQPAAARRLGSLLLRARDLVFAARGPVQPRLRPHLLDEVRAIVSATAIATMARDLGARHRSPTTLHLGARPRWPGSSPLSSCRSAGPGCSRPRARAISRGEGRTTLIVGAGRIGNLVAAA